MQNPVDAQFMKSFRSRTTAGFTLVELLVVIVIIAVLVALSVTVSLGFRKQADRTSAMNAMRQLQVANISYATENSGSFVPPEADIKDSNGVVTGTYKWFENPDFISQLKGQEATFSGSGAPDLSLPVSLMDLAVIREKGAQNTRLNNCFAYTAPSAGSPFRQAQLSSPADSAAFITFDGPFVEHSTRNQIAYRHKEKAIVVYYDGRASIIAKKDVDRIDDNGGASNPFWNASGGPVAP